MFNYVIPKPEGPISTSVSAPTSIPNFHMAGGAVNPDLLNRTRIAANIADINRTIQGYTQGLKLNNTV